MPPCQGLIYFSPDLTKPGFLGKTQTFGTTGEKQINLHNVEDTRVR